MSTDAIFAVTRFGLSFERARMEAASRNIAIADLPQAQRAGAAASTGNFAQTLVGTDRGATVGAGDAGHPVLDPGNPMAGPDGMVRYPDTDLAHEMTTLMSAQRAYQADIRAFNTLHGMLMKSLSIGGR